MAGTVIDTPNTPPSVDADWDKVIANYVVGGKGQNSVSLTEWASANTAKPAVASGSTIEVNGSFVTFTATVIGDDGSLVTGTIYLYIDTTTTPGTALPKFTNTVPVWDSAKGGFYRTNDRYTGHRMEWDGASAYTEKGIFIGHIDDAIDTLFAPDNTLKILGALSFGTRTYRSVDVSGATATFNVTEKGLVCVTALNGNVSARDFYIEEYINGAWRIIAHGKGGTASTAFVSATVLSDGTNVRFRHLGAATGANMYVGGYSQP